MLTSGYVPALASRDGFHATPTAVKYLHLSSPIHNSPNVGEREAVANTSMFPDCHSESAPTRTSAVWGS